MNEVKLKTDSRVEFHSTGSVLDGMTGSVVGISSEFATGNVWIVGLDKPLPDRKAVVMTDACLKSLN